MRTREVEQRIATITCSRKCWGGSTRGHRTAWRVARHPTSGPAGTWNRCLQTGAGMASLNLGASVHTLGLGRSRWCGKRVDVGDLADHCRKGTSPRRQTARLVRRRCGLRIPRGRPCGRTPGRCTNLDRQGNPGSPAEETFAFLSFVIARRICDKGCPVPCLGAPVPRRFARSRRCPLIEGCGVMARKTRRWSTCGQLGPTVQLPCRTSGQQVG